VNSRLWIAALAVAILVFPVLAEAANTPFGTPGEGAAKAPTNALLAWITAQQSAFYQSMQGMVGAIRNGGSLLPVLGLALAYGVFHAAGPGHGKAVISSYVVAEENAALKGIAVAFGAALVQALVAIAAVLFVIMVLGLAGRARTQAFGWIELAGYGLIVLLGLSILWRKGKSAWLLWRGGEAEACDHEHLPGPEMMRGASWKTMAGAMLAAGIRPCTGAIIMFTFCLAQGLYLVGVLTVLTMALGTALTTAALALLSVYGKGLALRLASGRTRRAEAAKIVLESAAALVLLGLGLLLVFGFLSNGPLAA
jgi:nickel/cobalt transporter (NicO) family protein